jgi:MATE family multidrug resistance protein
LLLVLQTPVRETALWLLSPSAETTALARAYFDIRIWSAPAALCNLAIIGWLLGMQNARGPLAMVVTISLVNAGLDLWFVLGLQMTVAGVALATVLAEFAGLLVGATFVRAELNLHKPIWEFRRYGEISRYRALFAINGNLFLRSMALLFTFAFITAQGARLGDSIMAANAVLMNFLYFMAYALDGIAHAAEALTGKAVGARNRQGLEIAVNRTLLWSGGFAGLFCMAYFIAGSSIISLLSDLPVIRETAQTYLPWLIAAPLISVWCFLYDGVYVGITRAREMRIVMICATLLVFLPTWYLFRTWGNHALWLALMLFMAARGVGMHLWYRRMLSRNELAG